MECPAHISACVTAPPNRITINRCASCITRSTHNLRRKLVSHSIYSRLADRTRADTLPARRIMHHLCCETVSVLPLQQHARFHSHSFQMCMLCGTATVIRLYATVSAACEHRLGSRKSTNATDKVSVVPHTYHPLFTQHDRKRASARKLCARANSRSSTHHSRESRAFHTQYAPH